MNCVRGVKKAANNKVLIVLLIFTIIILLVLCILFATGAIGLKNGDIPTDNNNTSDEINTENVSIMNSFQNYLNLYGTFIGAPGELLRELNIDYTGDDAKVINEYSYFKANISYNDFKNKMLEYVSESTFIEKFTKFANIECFKEIDGMLYFLVTGATGRSFKVKEITKMDNKYIAKVDETLVNDDIVDTTFEFTIVEHNEKYVIDSVKEL